MLFSNHHHPNRFFVRPLLTFTTLALFAVACSLFSKKSETPVTSIKNKPTNEMPTPPALPIASGDYADEWKIVDSLQQQGLYKSALEKVTAIQARAQRDKNAPQLVKALIFRGKFTAQLEEDGLTNAILLLEKEMQAAGQPEKAVLQSVVGQLYRVYLEHQGWEIGDRTPVPAGEGGDILTWSADQIEKQALDLYAASVEPAALLATVPLGQFRDITLPGANDTVGKQALWPTLYDLLAQRAIEHFSNERNYLTEPAYAFQLDQASAFAPAEEFVRLAFDSQDITSGKWHAIRLFQKVLAAHLGARDAAFYEAELKRLQFVKNNSTLENKDELYQKAIEKLLGQTENHDSHAEIAHALAGHLHHTEAEDKGANARNAVRILEAAIQRKPDTYGAALCRQLLADIRQPALSTTVEVINPPDQHILVQLGYKNLQKVWIRVVKENADIEKNGRMSWKEKFDRMLALPSLQSRSWDIQNPGDYQMHSTEIALEPLAFGHYWVIVSSNPDFRIDDGPVVFTALDVSNLAVVTYLEKGESRFVLADRNSGTPLESVKLDFFYRDYNTQKSVLKHYGSTLSDRNGFARGNWPERYSMEVRASKGADTIWLNPLQNYRSYDRSEERPAVQFFTDRSIYRPGQTVYFKGLVYKSLQNENGLPQILPNRSVKVQFFDVNGQEKHSITLKSNEFGTFNGAFTAPATGLTGNMSIRATDGAYGATYFNVEEYKRPRFEVTLQPVKGEFRVNEKITMRGEAKNYAGNVVDGASVRYRVLRNAVFPYWDFSHPWRRPWYFDSGEMEIANGVTKSGADGTFSIEFTAIPDPSIPKKSQPTFYYQVMVDVTDITGETRSTESSVNVGYVALQVDWELNNDIHLDSLRHVGLKTTNMAGQVLTAQGEITLQRLVAPRRFYKDRMWERPDLTTLAKADFERMFPGLAWKDEDDPKNWGREDFTRTVRFNTADAQTFDLNEGRTQPGWYVVTLRTKDAFGEVIEIQKFVRVWDAESRFEKPDARLEKNRLEPGETAQMLFGGKPDQLHFFFAQENDGIIQKPEWVSARIANLARVEIPVREENRGGIPLHWFCIKDGRIYSGNPQVVVPWSNKELTISYESFRDKLAPGQKEEWRIKISGPKKEKVAAEMVAAMYDASLDQFAPHSWSGLPLPYHYAQISFRAERSFTIENGMIQHNMRLPEIPQRIYPTLNWFDFPMWGRRIYKMGRRAMAAAPAMDMDMAVEEKAQVLTSDQLNSLPTRNVNAVVAGGKDGGDKEYYVDGVKVSSEKAAPPAQIRRNLNETVFFFPELRTDAEGNVILKFTMNEALTRWKLLTYAHTKDLKQAISVKEVVTQKELMVIANPPRFLRQGDEIEFSAKISNLSTEKMEGIATIGLLDAATLSVVEKEFGMTQNNRLARFSVLPGQSGAVSWRLKVPDDYAGAITWQIFAECNSWRDGEESTLPVVANRMLVTETLPVSLRGKQSKTFTFEHLKKAPEGKDATLKTHRYALEFTSNPVWYAVQSLPYLMEFQHECTEQIFSRYYANTLAGNVVEKMPAIRRVYERWKGTGAMQSNLSKNQELKYALLEETPWVLDAQQEAQQKQNIALLFDLNRMADERERALGILAERQLGNGGWAWFPGGQDSWYITQHIAGGFAHLQKLGALDLQKDQRTAHVLDNALVYCDVKIAKQYAELERLAREGKADLNADHLDGMAIQYLYVKSFFPLDRPSKEAGYYLSQAEKYWLGKGLYQEGMLALALHRHGNKEAAARIVASLRERATMKEELGMFWPVDWGYYWYQLPVETQALMVEVFSEVAADTKAVEELRIWLLKNKQTNRWESTKATAEAVYALLLNGDNWLNNTQPVQVTMGGKPLKVNEVEAGTGYFKQEWPGPEVNKSWADLKVENPNSNIVWGAAYWQYFEDLDKIESFKKTPLTIVKQLFLEENSPTGPVLKSVAEGQSLRRGDKLKVRIEIRVDRAMEFVHLKDMRAAGLEPVNVISGYRWQGGLGYYESTKDLATHFFIDYLPRGTFVFEYPLVVSLRGDMSNGIATMQCMYAPEFTSHSKGVRVKVE